MLRKREPLKDTLALIGGFYEKSMYKTRRTHNLTNKQFCVLHQCYLLQYYGNGLVTCSALRAIAPLRIVRIPTFITVLLTKGYLIRVDPPYPRKDAKGKYATNIYNVTPQGENVINMFSKLLNTQVDDFKASKKWKRLPKDKKGYDYFESLGIIRNKS